MEKRNSEQLVNNILSSLDGLEKASAPPNLYTRIRGKMQENNSWQQLATLLSRPVIAITLVLLLLGTNAYFVFRSTELPAEENGDQLTAVANEYQFEVTSSPYQSSEQP